VASGELFWGKGPVFEKSGEKKRIQGAEIEKKEERRPRMKELMVREKKSKRKGGGRRYDLRKREPPAWFIPGEERKKCWGCRREKEIFNPNVKKSKRARD